MVVALSIFYAAIILLSVVVSVLFFFTYPLIVDQKLSGPQAVMIFAILFYAIPLSGYAEYYFNNLNFLAKMVLLTFICYGFRHREPITVTC